MPRIIHTIIRASHERGLKRDVEAKHTTRPRGIENKSVNINNKHVVPKPVRSCLVTSVKVMVIAESIMSEQIAPEKRGRDGFLSGCYAEYAFCRFFAGGAVFCDDARIFKTFERIVFILI